MTWVGGSMICMDCDIDKPIEEFNNVEYRHCKTCLYLNKYNPKVLENWSIEEYIIILDKILNQRISYINELVDYLNKPLKEIMDLLKFNLKIYNKKLELKTNCNHCNKEIIVHLGKFYTNKNIFCSHECYAVYKLKTYPKGKDNPQYNRIKTKCTNCDKEIEINPFKYREVNKFGDNHNFCSQECYWNYRKIYYVGEKSGSFGYVYTNEVRNKMREINIMRLKENPIVTNTKPQLIINKLLDSLNIKYLREKDFKYYAVDNYLINNNLIIEVMGDYWHGSPIKYKEFNKLNSTQRKNIKQDKSKNTYILKYYNINILYLWEFDILNNLDLCEKLILEYVYQNGNLNEYNSFNYEIKNNKLKLKEKIVLPYFIKNLESVETNVV